MSSFPLQLLLVNVDAATERRLRELLGDRVFDLDGVTVAACRADELLPGIDESDVVLVGRNESETDPIELLECIRTFTSHLPVLFVDTEYDRERDEATIAAGADDYYELAELTPRLLHRSIRNATERCRYRSALERSERQLRTVMRDAPVILFAIDMAGRITFAEGKALAGLGVIGEQLVGNLVTDLFPDDEDVAITLQRALSGEEFTRQLYLGGSIYECHYSSGRNSHGEMTGISGIAVDVTSRTLAERQLRDNNDRFRLMIENAHDIITLLEPDGTIRYESPSIEGALGYSMEELLGTNVLELIHPDDRSVVIEILDAARSIPGSTGQAIVRFRHADGTWRTLDATGTNLLHDPAIKGFVINSRDVTGRIRMEQEREQLLALVEFERRRLEELVAGISGVVWEKRGGRDPQSRVMTFMSTSVESLLGYTREEVIGFDQGWISLIHPDDLAEFLHLLERQHLPGNYHRTYRMLRRDGVAIWIESYVVASVDAEGNLVERGISLDVTERRYTEEALRQSEERFQTALKASSLIICNQDLDLYYTWATNPLIGRGGSIIGKRHEDFLSEEDSQYLNRIKREVIDSGIGAGHEINIVIDGIKRCLSLWIEPLFDRDGVITGITSSAYDLTDYRESQNALNRHRALFQAFIDHSPAITFIKDADGRYVAANRRFTDLLGLSQNDIIGKSDAEIFPQEIAEEYRRQDLEVLAQLHARESIERNKLSPVEAYWHSTKFPIQDDTGAILIGGSAFDITARVHAQQQVREERRRIGDLISSIPGIVWETVVGKDGPTRRPSFVSDYIETLLGYPPSEWLGEQDFWLKIMHPDDRERAAAETARIVADGGVGRIEYRWITRDGRTIWVEAHLATVHDESGSVIGMRGVTLDITGRRVAEQALRLSEERFQLAARATNDLIWDWDLRTDQLWWNYNVHTLLGYPVGEQVTDISVWESRIHPDDRERAVGSIRRAARSGERFWSDEYRFQRRDGSYAVLLDRGYVVHDPEGKPVRMIGAMVDISELRKAADALRESQRSLQALFENAQDTILLADDTGRYVDVNPAAGELTGYDRDELIGADITLLTTPGERSDIGEIFARFIEHERQQGSFRIVRKDGKVIEAEYRAVANIVPGLHLSVIRDVTDRVRAAQALQLANDQLELKVAERTAEIVNMMQKLERASRIQKRFIADASHDLRTPLTVLRAELDLLLRRKLDPEIRQAVQRLNRDAKRLDSLTGDLLVLATLEARESNSGFRIARLDELMMECASQLGAVAAARGISWVVESEEPFEIQCDEGSIRRMLTNLMENAIKYSETGGTVTLRLERDGAKGLAGDTVVFTISDTGVGIAEQDLPRVFDRFYRGDLTRSTPGTGLGLAIVRAVALSHGGDTEISSIPGAGTTVIVRLPVAIPGVKLGREKHEELGYIGAADGSARSTQAPQSGETGYFTRLEHELDLARSQSLSPVLRESLDMLDMERQQLDMLARDLLYIASREESERPLENYSVRLDELLFDLLIEGESDLVIHAADSGISWQVACDEPVEILGNADSIRRAMNRLLETAVRHARRGSVVVISLRRTTGSNGEPTAEIAAHELGSQVAPLGNGEEVTRTPRGLELAIIRALVELAGGVLSPDGWGILLPVSPDSD